MHVEMRPRSQPPHRAKEQHSQVVLFTFEFLQHVSHTKAMHWDAVVLSQGHRKSFWGLIFHIFTPEKNTFPVVSTEPPVTHRPETSIGKIKQQVSHAELI